MKKFVIGEYVKEGGPLGSVCVVVGITEDGKYIVESLNGNATGYLEECYLFKIPQPKKYEQLSLF